MKVKEHIKTHSVFTGLIITLILSGCTPIVKKSSIEPLKGSPVIKTETPYTSTLQCIGNAIPENKKKTIVISVEKIPDKTGKFNYNEDGYKITQGAEDMMISAIAKTNAFRMVERLNLTITQYELDYAFKHLLKDANQEENIVTSSGKVGRAVTSGMLLGSDYIVAGSVTELNFNVGSGGFDLSIAGYGVGWRAFWVDVAMDLRVIDTATTEIVLSIPLRKQVWGYENKAGLVRFFGETFYDISAGGLQQERMQIAVRSIIEDAAGMMAIYLYDLPADTCADVEKEFWSNDSANSQAEKTPSRQQYQTEQENQGEQSAQEPIEGEVKVKATTMTIEPPPTIESEGGIETQPIIPSSKQLDPKQWSAIN